MEKALCLTEDSEKRLWRGYLIFYFFLFSCVMLDSYNAITMFRNAQWTFFFIGIVSSLAEFLLPVLMGIQGIAMILSLFKKCPASFSYTTEQIVVAALCCGALLVPYLLYDYTEPFWFAALILGAHNMDYKKIVRFYFILSVVLCTVTFLCGVTGIVENLVYHREDGTARIAFGFNYPTDFCSHIFFLVVCWLWLREERTTYLEIGGIAALAAFAYLACDARTTTITLTLLALWMVAVKLRSRKTDGRYRMTKPLQACCFLAPPLGAACMLLFSVFYDENNPLLSLLNRVTSTRIQLGNIGLCRYRITLFGQTVLMNGNGGSTILPDNYFFLDCTYLNILLRYGVITLLIALYILFYTTLAEQKKGAFIHVGLIGVVALQCVIEQHLMEIGHTPLLLFLLACDGTPQNGFGFLRFIERPHRKPKQS